MKQILNQKFLTFNDRRAMMIIMSLLIAWIVCFPYEGQLLYTLAKSYNIEGNVMLDVSLAMQVVGLILGGIFIRTLKAARKIIIYAIPVCILCTISFFFPSYVIWKVTLTACAALAGICIASFGLFFKNLIEPNDRFRTLVEIILYSNILKMLINNISLYISIQAAFAFTIIMLGAALFLTLKIPFLQHKKIVARIFDKKTGFKVLSLLFLSIVIITFDFGIAIEAINPKYSSSEWLASWYWILPYIIAVLIMRSLKKVDDRSNILYIAVGMMGLGFILFLVFDHSVSSYLIVNTVMTGACAIGDVFYWGILIEMTDMVKRPAKIFSIGCSGSMIGILLGKIIAGSNPTISGANLSIVSLAVVCATLFILPILNKLLSKMMKKNAVVNTAETNMMNLPDGIDALTEREKQIAALLLKGRTCKLIAMELYLSENTVKTHIKNIYSKLGVKRKSELFNFMME